MTSAEFEMVDLSKTPCIDAALACIGKTRSARLGVGKPITGQRFELEEERLIDLYVGFSKFYLPLTELSCGGEAWSIALGSIIHPIDTFLLGFWEPLSNLTSDVNCHGNSIVFCRQKMDELMANLVREKNLFLSLSTLNLAAVRALDAQAANAAMNSYNQLMSDMKISTALLVGGVAAGVQAAGASTQSVSTWRRFW